MMLFLLLVLLFGLLLLLFCFGLITFWCWLFIDTVGDAAAYMGSGNRDFSATNIIIADDDFDVYNIIDADVTI